MASVVLETLYAAATSVYTAAKAVKINAEQCALLAERVRAVVDVVEPNTASSNVTAATTAALNHLVDVVRRCASGIADFQDAGWIERGWNKSSDDRLFETLNDDLRGAAASLQLSLQMDAVFDRERDRQAQEAGHTAIRATLNVVAERVVNVDNTVARIETSVDSLHTKLGALTIAVAVVEPPHIDVDAYKAKCVSLFKAVPHLDFIDGVSGGPYRELGLLDVFVPQDVRPCNTLPMAQLEAPAEHRQRSGGLSRGLGTTKLISVDRLLEDDGIRSAVILGHPGAGKTSALRERALKWADPVKHSIADPFVILVELRQYGNEKIVHKGDLTLEDYVAGGGSVHFPIDRVSLVRQLNYGRTLLLLDGLDEVFDSTLRTSVVHVIATFAETYRAAACRIVLTSRIAGYDMAELTKCGFSHYALEPFTDKQIDLFIRKWHAVASKATETELSSDQVLRLSHAVAKVPSLRALCENPLLLSMLAFLNHESEELPTKRVQLFEKCVELMISRWEASKSAEIADGTPVGQFDSDQKEKMLRDLAWEMHKNAVSLGNIVSESTVIKVFCETVRPMLEHTEPRPVAKSLLETFRLRHGILCFLGGKEYAFVHRTFLEYLCARAVHEMLAEDAMSTKELHDFFVTGAGDPTRHEILRLLSGLMATADVAPCLDAILSLNPILAGECALQLREPSKAAAVVGKLRKPLEEIAVRFIDFNRYAFPSNLMEETVQAISILPALWNDEGAKKLLQHVAGAQNPNPGLSNFGASAAIHELRVGWPSLETSSLLAEIAVANVPLASEAAVHELAEGWPNDQKTGDLLIKLMFSGKFGWQQAVHEFGFHWPDRQERWLCLMKLSERYGSFGLRSLLDELHAGWPTDPLMRAQVKNVLKDQATKGAFSAEITKLLADAPPS